MTAWQAVWLGALMNELMINVSKPLKLLIDNTSTISLAKNLVLHGRSKHIDTKYHFLRDQVHEGLIDIGVVLFDTI